MTNMINIVFLLVFGRTDAFFKTVRTKSHCDLLPTPRNGFINCTGEEERGHRIGSKCTFTCEKGFEISGTTRTSCNKKGDWTSTIIPECINSKKILQPVDTPLYTGEFKPTFSTEDMVSFLEFILDNPQTNTEHAFRAFVNDDLYSLSLEVEEPEPLDDGKPEVRTMKTPVIEPVSAFHTEYDPDEDFESAGFAAYNVEVDSDYSYAFGKDNSFKETVDEPVPTRAKSTTTARTTSAPITTTTENAEIATPNVVLSTLESEYFALSWTKVPEARSYELMLFDTASNAVQDVFTTEEQFYVFTEMLPETKYQVMVHAVSATGARSLASVQSVVTKPPPPDVNVDNLSPTKIRVNWSRLRQAVSYLVTVKTASGDVHDRTFEFPTFDSIEVTDLSPDTDYIIEVDAILLDNVSVATIVDHRTAPATPVHITNLSTTSDSVSIQWSPALGAIKYIVEIVQNGIPVDSKIISSSSSSATIGGLAAYTEYDINVKAFFNPTLFTSEELSILTRSTAPLVTSREVTDSSIALSWAASPGSVGYTLKITEAGASSSSRIITTTENQISISEQIEPFTNYQVTITAGFPAGHVDLSTQVDVKTDPAAPELTISQVGTRDVQFSWSQVPGVEEYSTKLTLQNGALVDEYTVSALTSTFQFNNLNVWTAYTITVTAKTASKSFTGSADFRTLSVAPVLSAVGTSSNSASISWTALSGLAGDYSVTISSSQSGAAKSVTTAENFLEFFDLQPFTKYTISLSCKTQDELVYESTLALVTDPNNPELTLESTDSTSALLTWSKVPSVAKYSITVADSIGAIVDRADITLARYSIKNLTPYRHYTVTVDAHYNDKLLRSSIDIVTDPEAPSLELSDVTPISGEVSWLAVPGAESYIVTCRKPNGKAAETVTFPAEGPNTYSALNLDPDATFSITVEAVKGDKTFPTTISLRTSAIPGISSVNVNSIRSTSIELSWEVVSVSGLVPIGSKVIYFTDSSRRKSVQVEAGVETLLLEDLVPESSYSIEVVQIFPFGTSAPTTTGAVTTPLLANVNVEDILSRSAQLTWTALSSARSYVITVVPELRGADNPINVFTNHFTLNDLDVDTEYSLTIFAEFDASQTLATDLVDNIALTTAPEPPLLIVDDITSTSMKLASTSVPDARKYEVVYFTASEPEIDTEVVLHGDGVDKIISGLEPETEYVFKIRAVLEGKHTDWVEARYTTAPIGTDLWFDHIRSTSLIVHWAPIANAESYVLTISGVGEHIFSSETHSATISDLEASTEYDFHWVARMSSATTDPSLASQITAHRPPQMSISDIRSTKMDISWEENDSCNEYNLAVLPVAENRVERSRTDFSIQNLKPDTIYSISIICIVGFGQTDEQVVMVKSQVAAPVVKLNDLRSSSAKISWTRRAEYELYSVDLVPSGKSDVITENSIAYDGLEDDTDYTVTIRTQAAGGFTDDVIFTFKTAPAAPTILFDSIRSTEVGFNWPSHDRVDFYRVQITPALVNVPKRIMTNELVIFDLPPSSSFVIDIIGVGNGFETDMSVATFETAPSPPEVSVSAVRTDEFTISWSEVANASLIEIAIVPAPELSSDGVFQLHSADRQFTLERLDAETVYHVTLKALIQSVIVTDSIQFNQLTAPLPPVVYATEIRSSSMEIQWTTIPEAAYYVLDVYPRPESLPGSAEESFELLENSILLTELRAETRYEITVWAVLISGSTTNEAAVSQTTAPLPPRIILKEARTTRASLIFTPIRNTIEYQITVDPPIAGISDFSRTDTQLNLLQTRPDVEYTVTIIAQLEGKATDSRALTFTSAPSPVVASGKDKRSTSIHINWDPVPEAHRYYAEITPPTNSGISRMPIYTNFVQLSDLSEDTFYNMTITAVSARSTWTTDDHICAFSTAPKMSKLTTSDVTSHAMMLSWAQVEKIDMYRLEFSPSIGSSKYETASEIFVDNMESDTEYEISIVGIGDDFETDPYRLTRFTAPPAPVITFPSIKSRRLDLEWNSLPDDYYWIVNIYPVPAGHEDTWPLMTSETTFTALGLEPESEYSFTIRAVSEQRALVTDLTTIGQETAPLGPPIKVPNHTVRTTSAVVEWEEIPTAISYKVFAKSLHSGSYDVHYTTSAISHVLQDLQALAEYEVSVLALLAGNGVTDVSITTFTTAPEPPTFEVVRARVKKDSTVHVNSTWSSITDDDEYFINMSPPTGSFRSQLVTKGNEQFHITGLALGRPYRFGIFAKLPDGKRTDVRSVVYQTPSSPRCYECSSVRDPADCIAEVACPLNSGYSCMTFDRRENGRRMLTRGCKKRDACETQRKSHKCSRKHNHSCVLVGCCNDDLCNEGNRLN